MAIPLKYATAGQEVPLGYFLDPSNGDSEETALTINASGATDCNATWPNV